MNKSAFKKVYAAKLIAAKFICMVLFFSETKAQQFNSDNWLSKPHGTITLIGTVGQRNSMIMNTYSLFPKWEFTIAAYLYNDDGDPRTDDGYSTSFYAKYMAYQNKSATGGLAFKAGTGMFPGTITGEDREKDAFQSYWMNMPVTIPFLNNKISWDLMPGASMTRNYGTDETTAWSFTYSTRLAWAFKNPKWNIVGEMFGTAGGVVAIPEYKLGLRYEPSQYAVFALTYGHEFSGSLGAGFEIGVMLFTPPFACLCGCNTEKKTKKKKSQPPL